MSKQFSKQKKEHSVERAYHLWIYGQGDQQDPYVDKLRDSMIKNELKDSHQSAGLFLPEDKVGNKIWFTHLIKKHPTVAYDVAQRIQDQHLLQQARERMVTQSPLEAFEKFQKSGEKDKDIGGVDLALDALATQYGVSREKIDEYLALKK